VVSRLFSRLEGRGFESHHILDENGVKAIPGSILVPSPGSFNLFENKENIGSQMGHTKKFFKKEIKMRKS
jgi:hypothetical protein